MGFTYGRQNVRGASNLPVFASAAETWELDSRTRMGQEPGRFLHRQHQHPKPLDRATSRSDVVGGGHMLTTTTFFGVVITVIAAVTLGLVVGFAAGVVVMGSLK